MSWSFGVINTPLDELDSALNHAAEGSVTSAMEGDAGPEATSQMEQAVYAAIEIAKSGALGPGPFSVRLHGHANPNHERRPGWSQDGITVTVEQPYDPNLKA